MGSPLDHGPIAELVRGDRWDDALEALYRARAERPDDVQVSEAIRVVRERALDGGVAQLGGLEAIVHRTGVGGSDDADAVYVLRLVDGTSSVADLLERSTLGRHRTARALRLLNAARAVRSARAASMVPEGSAVVRSVLLADAHGPSAALTRTILRAGLGTGTRVSTVGSVDALVATGRDEPPDLVISELQLPGGDGILGLRSLRRALGLVVPALVVASRAEHAAASERAPARCAVLARPIEKAALLSALGAIGMRGA